MSWYCVHTRPQQEYIALESIRRNLTLNHDGIYLPEMPRDKRYYKSRKQSEMMPLFPRYLFVYLREGEDDFRKITKAHGVSYILHFGNEPEKMTEAEIEAVRQYEAAHLPPKEYVKGERVLVKGLGYEAEFLKSAGKWAFILLGDKRMKVKKRELEPVN